MNVVNGYPRVTGTGIFNTSHVNEVSMDIIVFVPVDTHTPYTLI